MFDKLREKIASKRIAAFESIEGWLSPNEALGLYMIAHKLPAGAIAVEIGSWQGKSTYCIAKGLRSGTVYAIDPFNGDGGQDFGSQNEYNEKKGSQDLLEVFNHNMRRLEVSKKIIAKQGYSAHFKNDFNKIDFLFIDGDHSIAGCKSDFELYSNKIVSGGYIAFHDYYPDRPDLGPTNLIQNHLAGTPFKFYKKFDSLWVGRKV